MELICTPAFHCAIVEGAAMGNHRRLGMFVTSVFLWAIYQNSGTHTFTVVGGQLRFLSDNFCDKKVTTGLDRAM